MNYYQLFKTTMFVKNLKKDYNHLDIGKEMKYEFHQYDKGKYAIAIKTDETTIDGEITLKIALFFNKNQLLWFMGTRTGEIVFYAQ